MINKKELRQALIAKRSAIASELREQWSASIASRLLAWLETYPVKELGIYWPIKGEPDLRSAYGDLKARGIRLALPVIIAKNAPLEFAEWQPGDELVKDGYGVSVPANHVKIRPQTLLVPCVGFNSRRFRLGYGGGFYDRTLAQTPRPHAIGIAYHCLSAEFDADSHDVPLDAIITESGLL